MIHQGRAPRITQPEEGATYDPLLKKANVKVVYSKSFWYKPVSDSLYEFYFALTSVTI